MQLLGVHIDFKLQLRLQCNLLNLEHSHSTLFLQVSFMLAFHLGFFLVTSQLLFFVAVQMVLDALCNYFLHFSLAFGWVSNGLFCHYSQIVGHCDTCLRRWHQPK